MPDKSRQFFDVIASELCICLRGARTQQEISQKLGVSINTVYRWEAGKAAMTWSRFIELCQTCEVNLEAALASGCSYQGYPSDIARLTRHFLGESRLSPDDEDQWFSNFKVKKWMSGRGDPALHEVLRIINFGPLNPLPNFLAELLTDIKTPTIQGLVDKISSITKEQSVNPLTGAVAACLSLSGYGALERHVEGWIAKRLAIPLETEVASIATLTKLGIVEFDGKKYFNKKNYSTMSAEDVRIIGDFWIQLGSRLHKYYTDTKTRGEFGSFGYHVAASSSEAHQKIMQRYLEFYSDVVKIIDSDSDPREHVQIFTMGMFDAGDALKTLSAIDATSRP